MEINLTPEKPKEKNQKKMIMAVIIGVCVILIALAAGYFLLYYQGPVVLEELPFSSPQQQAVAEIEELVEVEEIEYDTADVVSEKVTEEIPELNPVEKANPFKEAYKNPFE